MVGIASHDIDTCFASRNPRRNFRACPQLCARLLKQRLRQVAEDMEDPVPETMVAGDILTYGMDIVCVDFVQFNSSRS
eukprot:4712422-Pyramimonas_sp.AAC.1